MASKIPWAIILCQYPDEPAAPRDPAWFRELLCADGQGTGNLVDYWRDVSRGELDLSESQVFGWFDLPNTRASEIAKHVANKAKNGGKDDTPWRYLRIAAGIDVAREQGVDLSPFTHVMVVHNAKTDVGGAGTVEGFRGVLIDRPAWDADWPGGWVAIHTIIAHEMGHGHGFPDSQYLTEGVVDHYNDELDIMSAMSNLIRFPSTYGLCGPGLGGALQASAGWLPMDRVHTVGPTATEIQLQALPSDTGTIAARITDIVFPGPTAESGQYLVEYRSPTGWDRGLSGGCVVVRFNSASRPSVAMPSHATSAGQHPIPERLLVKGSTFVDPMNDVMVTVLDIDDGAGRATIRVGPLPSAEVTTSVVTIDSTDAGSGEYDFPGILGRCLAETYTYAIVHQHQQVTIQAKPPHPNAPALANVHWAVEGVPITGPTGSLTVSVDAGLIPAPGDAPFPHDVSATPVVVDYETSGTSLELRNRVQDGQYLLTIDMHGVVDGDPVHEQTTVRFDGIVHRFNPADQAAMNECWFDQLYGAIYASLKDVPIGKLVDISPTLVSRNPARMPFDVDAWIHQGLVDHLRGPAASRRLHSRALVGSQRWRWRR